MKSDIELAKERLSDRLWRLENLYYILDKEGKKRKFKLNWAQRELYDNLWYLNAILKARQLGVSTFVCLLFLDTCLFNSNTAAGIIAHTREDSEQLFQRVKFAYDNLPEPLKEAITVQTDRVGELKFANGSQMRVGTSLRSSTFQLLHISEFGKICAKYPDKAREIVTGALNTVSCGLYIFIESTAEGREGAFFDICKRAQELKAAKKKLSPLDFKFHFFPWWRDPSYQLDHWLPVPPQMKEYFEKLKLAGIDLTEQQKFWYVAKKNTQGEDMGREYPSTPEEAFLSSSEGLYYGSQMVLARAEKRVGNVPHDASAPCFTAWDLGYNDATAIWIYQTIGKEIHLIDYVEDFGKPLTYYLELLSKKPYKYDKHFVPHDASAHELSTGLSRVEVARNLGFNMIVASRLPVMEGIDATRTIFNRCWFEETKCARGITALENYKKEWNDRLGCWDSKPLHNFASHGADAFRILATTLMNAANRSMSPEDLDRSYKEALGFTGLDFFSPQPYLPGFGYSS